MQRAGGKYLEGIQARDGVFHAGLGEGDGALDGLGVFMESTPWAMTLPSWWCVLAPFRVVIIRPLVGLVVVMVESGCDAHGLYPILWVSIFTAGEEVR